MNADAPFALDPRLAADCHVVGELPLSRVLLMNDLRFPWLILVPRIAGLRELVELDRDYRRVAEEGGVVSYRRVPTVGTDSRFIGALADLVRGTAAPHGSVANTAAGRADPPGS